MGMVGRQYTANSSYRFGFNGKENDSEVKGEGNQQDYGMRIYDPRLGRFLSVDPIFRKYPSLTTYQFASNRPLDGIDLDGLEFLKKLSVYGLQRFEQIAENYTMSHLWIKNQEIHRIVMRHPENTSVPETVDDGTPEVKVVEPLEKDSKKHKWAQQQAVKAANRSMRGDIATGIADFIKWGITTFYDSKYKKEMSEAGASIHALNNADNLARNATEISSFPTKLSSSEIFLMDLVNYLTDGTRPSSDDVLYVNLVQSWGQLIYNNREKISEKSYSFAPMMEVLHTKTIRIRDGHTITVYSSEMVGNPDPELKKCNDLLENTVPPNSPTIKSSN